MSKYRIWGVPEQIIEAIARTMKIILAIYIFRLIVRQVLLQGYLSEIYEKHFMESGDMSKTFLMLKVVKHVLLQLVNDLALIKN